MSTARKSVDSRDNVSRHWQLGPARGVEQSASGQAIKIITPLSIACGLKDDGPSGACGPAVVVFLVQLSVGAEFDAAVTVELNPETGDNVAWARMSNTLPGRAGRH